MTVVMPDSWDRGYDEGWAHRVANLPMGDPWRSGVTGDFATGYEQGYVDAGSGEPDEPRKPMSALERLRRHLVKWLRTRLDEEDE